MITISAFLPCVRVKGCLEGHTRTRVNVKVEPRSTFTFTHGLPPSLLLLRLSYFASFLFTCVRTEKLVGDSRNQPLSKVY